MKTITVYNSANSELKEIKTNATTRSEVEKALKENDIAFNNMSFIVAETENSLVTPQSVVPEGDFTLMLSPKKVKSGGYKELKEYIKSQRENNEKAREFFGNYTQKTTPELESLVVKWKGKSSSKSTSVVSSPVKASASAQRVNNEGNNSVSNRLDNIEKNITAIMTKLGMKKTASVQQPVKVDENKEKKKELSSLASRIGRYTS